MTFAAVGRGEAAVGVPVGHVADAVVVAAVVDDGAAGSCCTQKQTLGQELGWRAARPCSLGNLLEAKPLAEPALSPWNWLNSCGMSMRCWMCRLLGVRQS